MRSLREIRQLFPASFEKGLSSAEVSESLQRFGANRLTPLPRPALWKSFVGKFNDAIIKVLLAATVLKIDVDLFESSLLWGGIGLALIVGVLITLSALKLRASIPVSVFGLSIVLVGIGAALGKPSWEGLAVMVAIILATGIAFLAEYKSDREFEVLNAQKESLRAKAVRNGETRTLAIEEIVVGDLIILEMGDEVPADGRLIKANELYVDQSLLTGEAEPIHKRATADEGTSQGPDQPGCLYRGTQVGDGAGQMVVTEVGDLTMLGQIARRLSHDGEEATADEGKTAGGPESSERRVRKKLAISKRETPLQQKLSDLARLISHVGYAAAVAIFIAMLTRGLINGEVRLGPDSQPLRETVGRLLSYFVYMVIIIVVAVPEGLPMSVTISLALAMRKMTRANSLVRQLIACETIGSATIICSDKTGTLTQNRMQVGRVGLVDRVFDGDTCPPPQPAGPIHAMAFNSAINSTAHLESANGKAAVIGNSTEGALLQWAGAAGLDYARLRTENPVLYQMHFSSDRKRMTSVIDDRGRLLALVKGAPEKILPHCTGYLADDGAVRELDEPARARLAAALAATAELAMRTLAFASRPLPDDWPRDEDSLHERRDEIEKDLLLCGFVGMRDPLRPEVPAAIDECRDAGIAVMMITGDNIETARAIGREIGLLDHPDSLALLSTEFNSLTDDEALERLPRLKVLARALPLDKLRIVKLLQDQNHVVAVTGDGTNDAPALQNADVGLAMGITGTEVAKEASKIVLLDDSFATIVKAVRWGRALYENIQRFLQFQLTINVSALVIAFLGPFIGTRPPFTVLQLLWINVIMDTFAAIALCSEPPRPGLMRTKPKRRDERIVTPEMRIEILTTAVFFIIVMVTLLVGMKEADWFRGNGAISRIFPELSLRQVTIFFTAFVLFQVWNLVNCRSPAPGRTGLHRLHANPAFVAIAGAIVGVQLLVVSFGGSIFEVEPLTTLDWLFIAAATSSVLIFSRIVKRVRCRL